MTLNAEQILKADDLAREEVDVPEWGGSVYVRQLTNREAAEWEVWAADQDVNGLDYKAAILPRLLCLALVDAGGARLFTDDQVGALAVKSKRALERCFVVAMRLNSYTDADLEAAVGNLNGDRSS